METVKFDELQLDERIIRAITEMGFEEASPIQAQAIPVAMEGRDMIGQAQTGTGKTAAFGLPLLQKVDPKVKKLQAIVLLPTRELAIQVAEEMRRFAKFMHGVKVLPIYGGQDIVKQIRSLKDGTQVIVGTPGRVMDHMRRKTVKVDHVLTVVLDEADEMLNMGFLEDMETILSQLPEERQTLMFSATMPQAIPSLNDITEIKVEKILDQVQEVLNDTDLTKMVNIIEKKLMEEDYTSMDLAAALLKMSMGDESEDIIDSFETARSLDELDSFGRGSSRGRGRERSAYGNRRKGATDRAAVDYVLGEGDEKMARLFINIGKAQRITPGDILGAVAGESGIPGRMVGSIDMYDGYTFVDVPGRYADDVLKAMAHAKIKGKNIHVEKANTNRR